MSVYRFKVYLEDNEDVYRDFEIKVGQTFEQMHEIIQQAFKFDSKHAASFFVSDDYWRKGQEITLRKEDLPLEAEEIRKKVDPKKLMSEVKIAKYVEQPHQRFVYVFDPEVQWTFLVTMIKITDINNKLNYPAITKSIGNPPKQYKPVIVPKEELDPDLALAGLIDDLEAPDEEVYKAIVDVEEGVEDDDIKSLEGEEGEEAETETNGEEDSEASHDFHIDDETEET